MSTSIDQAFIRQYEAEVKHVFQREGSCLRGTVRTKSGVVGKSTTFQRAGKGIATSKGRHGVISPMNQDHTPIECVLEDKYAGDWVDKLDEAKTNIDERAVISRGGAHAIGRAIDDQIITALDGTTQSVEALAIASKAEALPEALSFVERAFANDVPNDGKVYGLITPRLWSIFSLIEEFSSADFVGGNGLPLTEGMPVHMRWRAWNGIMWKVHTGLPGVATAASKTFIYHYDAVGFAMGADITPDITWHGDRAAHWVNHMYSGGACLIDPTGVIEGSWDDTTAIPTS